MRGAPRLTKALLAGVLLAGCAHIEAPPGGPEDKDPPKLLATRPDTMARVAPFREAVVLAFDERLSEQGLRDAVLVSPRTSTAEVEHRGDEIRVSLRRGWEAGRIYQVTLLPGVQDLFNNRLTAPVRLVFSTGPAIPDTRLGGTVLDRVTGRPERDVRVEAIHQPDSLVYATVTDSAGGFTFAQVPEGEYRVRAYRDVGGNRVMDPFESRDTARTTLAAGRGMTLGLRVLQPDTTAPKVASVQMADSLVEVRFDDHLDPAQRVTLEQVTLTLANGTVLPAAEVRIGADTERPAQADTARAAAPRTEERLPSQSLFVRPARPLPAGTEVRVRVRGVWNLHGLVGGGEAALKTPPARPAAGAAPPPRP